jgi:hypothetical protein
MTRGPAKRGLRPTLLQSGLFPMFFGFLIDFMPVINGFSPFLGDIGHFWSPNFGRKLEMNNQLQIYINQACLRPWRTVKDSQSRVMLKEAKPKPFLCREDFEEQTLSGHFWELRTSVLRVVFFAGFLRSGRT